MSNCGCSGGTSRNGTKGGSNSVVDPSNIYIAGTFLGGATQTFCSVTKTLPIYSLQMPNIITFNENPCLLIGSKLIFENIDLANCLQNASKCVTVTALPTLVGTKWEVVTDANWSTSGTTNTITFGATAGFEGCATSSTKIFGAKVCSTDKIASNWSGQISTRPLNSKPTAGAVTVVSGNNTVSISANTDFRPQQGDLIEIYETAITGANKATITAVYTITNKSGSRITKVELDRVVTGITATAQTDGSICVGAIARPQPIGNLNFTPVCGCCIRMDLANSITNSVNFPRGREVGQSMNGCAVQEYCIVLTDNTAGAETPTWEGVLSLR
jgi:hypothetical protein